MEKDAKEFIQRLRCGSFRRSTVFEAENGGGAKIHAQSPGELVRIGSADGKILRARLRSPHPTETMNTEARDGSNVQSRRVISIMVI